MKRLRDSFSDVLHMYGVRIEKETTVHIFGWDNFQEDSALAANVKIFFYTLPPLYTYAVRSIKSTCTVYLDLGWTKCAEK
jgi:hypothetical protein